nr:hypothetical protein [Tanacetum cinerariifolium]
MRQSRLMKIISPSYLALIRELVPLEKLDPRKKQIDGHVERRGSTGGSQSESITGVLSQDYRRKCEAAEAAYEAKRKKELGLLECRELEFLMIDPSNGLGAIKITVKIMTFKKHAELRLPCSEIGAAIESNGQLKCRIELNNMIKSCVGVWVISIYYLWRAVIRVGV